MRRTLIDIAALAAPFAAGALGSIPTARSTPTWYRTLDKPDWRPPDWAFGPVWTTLYALMGLALLLVRRTRVEEDESAETRGPAAGVEPAETAHTGEAGSRTDTGGAQAVWALQLALNLAWSFVFFGARSLRGGLVVIAGLWVAILATIAAFWPIRRVAALLLVPYLAWVSFASLLNAEIARRNAR